MPESFRLVFVCLLDGRLLGCSFDVWLLAQLLGKCELLSCSVASSSDGSTCVDDAVPKVHPNFFARSATHQAQSLNNSWIASKSQHMLMKWWIVNPSAATTAPVKALATRSKRFVCFDQLFQILWQDLEEEVFNVVSS